MSDPVALITATPAEVEAALAAVPAVVLPIGTVEWHGPHLPLGLDGLKAQALAEGACRATGAVLAPTSYWAADGVDRPFTYRLDGDAIATLLTDVVVQTVAMGARVVLLVNGHYGLANTRAVRRAASAAMRQTGACAIALSDFDVLAAQGDGGDHAGVWETSLLWASHPELVRTARLSDPEPLEGVLGADPRHGAASPELGTRAFDHATRTLAAVLSRLLGYDAGARTGLLAALEAGDAVIDRAAELRERLGRGRAPTLAGESWRAHVDALVSGQDAPAAEAARRRLAELEDEVRVA